MAITEFAALQAIDEALSSLEEDERSRVLQYVLSKYPVEKPASGFLGAKLQQQFGPSGNIEAQNGEIPGIARLSPDGDFQLTVRDIKAKNTNDAAIRFVHVIVIAHELLTGDADVSSKEIIIPALRKWRAYTGNTRNAIAKHPGIIRNGDRVSLDAHAKNDAENYIKEILDDSVEGKWKPSSGLRKKSK